MNLIGKVVLHTLWGQGKIIDQPAGYIVVKFDNNSIGKKVFVYPDIFKNLLKCVDNTTELYIQSLLNSKNFDSNCHSTTCFQNSDVNRKLPNSLTSVKDCCLKFEEELRTEISCLKNNAGKHWQLFDGKEVEQVNEKYYYSFECDEELNLPSGTQITLWKGSSSFPGTIVDCEDFTIIISSKINLGKELDSMEFSAEPWHILEELINQLDIIRSYPSPIVKQICTKGPSNVKFSETIACGQARAIRMALSQPITFIWGPPGTGKTQTLAQIAIDHIKKNHTVLMLSYSNVSVDGAIMRVQNLDPDVKPGKLIRYGYARQQTILEHPFLTSYNYALQKHPGLLKERNKLSKERKNFSRSSKSYLKIGERLTTIKKCLKEEEENIVKKAQFVATTVSKAIVDSVIYKKTYDVVIFDEASMAYIPQIIFSASLATKHFVCLGDFCQLPPIVQSNSTQLNQDIFEYCGITTAVQKNMSHNWLCMLNIQYRMHPDISNFASLKMYNGLLKTHESIIQKRQIIADSLPAPNKAIAFADLSGIMSVCLTTMSGSHFNIVSAFIAFSMALEAATKFDVGIITPYRAQSRLLYAMSRDTAKTSLKLHTISCATVHQFQGSEKDVIIYDAVDCYRIKHPGYLLTSMQNNYANRLFNVALTRAKGKFVGIANINYMNNKNLSYKLMLQQMIQYQKRSYLNGKELIKENKKISGFKMSFFEVENGNNKFLRDIKNAKKEIHLDIPNGLVQSKYLCQIVSAIQECQKRGIKIYIRAENKNNLPLVIKHLSINYPQAINPIAIIDKQIIWFGEPMSNAHFKSNNQIIPTRYRPIIRFEGHYTATLLYGLLKMSNNISSAAFVSPNDKTDSFADYVQNHKICPECGRPLQLKKSKKGKFFLSCSGYPHCKHTELIQPDFVDEYLYRNGNTGQHCVRCGCSLEAKVSQYGIYVHCFGIPQHFFKLDEI
ncbi:AAA domain-containing protein [uncultured Megasphaera sp.]|uniref:AAA domain-containing protein n=1 Tax=uncultured Megasphaera sp. TaxID=165188 RepID=UPI0026075ADC|nr:AAA domain-containing protein [uncultured Megasphaera sp.]